KRNKKFVPCRNPLLRADVMSLRAAASWHAMSRLGPSLSPRYSILARISHHAGRLLGAYRKGGAKQAAEKPLTDGVAAILYRRYQPSRVRGSSAGRRWRSL